MAEFVIDGSSYRAGKMPARTQFHVLRRMTPMVEPLFALMGGGITDVTAVATFAKAVGALSDEDGDYIIDHCLTVVQRKQSETVWSNVTTPAGNHLMFPDIDLTVQLEIIARVLHENFDPLFQKGLAAWSGGASP